MREISFTIGFFISQPGEFTATVLFCSIIDKKIPDFLRICYVREDNDEYYEDIVNSTNITSTKSVHVKDKAR